MTQDRLERPDGGYEVQVTPTVRIPAGDGHATLAATLCRPLTDQSVPALVTLVPYRRDAAAGVMYRPYMRAFAEAGFASLLVDFRGTGSSDGAQRPPFDAAEADDGLAVIEWATQQSWCTGAVGMWGHSYGAITSMRVASQRPAGLKAIMPVMGAIDPERDFVHPYGHRGALWSTSWGMDTLANQLLPPLGEYGTLDEQARWLRRVHDTEPWLVGLLRDGAGAATWRTRVVDVAEITAPTFLVAGWRDLFCDGTFRAYEQINAPKRLLVGPWMHTMPDTAPHDRLDFCSVAVRWWDRWLRGDDSGAGDDPNVILYVQQDSDPWRRFGSWPPPSETVQLAATANDTLTATANEHAFDLAAEIDPKHPPIAYADNDPTVGALGGLWSLPDSASGLPVDQHDDDVRCLSFTSEPLADDLPIIGRARAAVTLGAGGPSRPVVRLTDVDAQGRSTLICSGTSAAVVNRNEPGPTTVTFDPTAYLLPAGHRLRVTLSAGDFPRLWPDPPNERPALALVALRLALPVAKERGEPAKLVTLAAPDTHNGVIAVPKLCITRDPVNRSVEVGFGTMLREATEAGAEFRLDRAVHARVGPHTPAGIHGSARVTATLPIGETVDVYVTLRMTDIHATATALIEIDGGRITERSWQIPISADASPEPEGESIP
jgi:uncharacterized protein